MKYSTTLTPTALLDTIGKPEMATIPSRPLRVDRYKLTITLFDGDQLQHRELPLRAVLVIIEDIFSSEPSSPIGHVREIKTEPERGW